jgi:hypothetical protein
MITLEVIQDNLPKFVELLSLDIALLAGIVAMIIGIVRTGKATEKLRDKNARERKRRDAHDHTQKTDLVHH